jgi:hypothetical protein
MVVGIPKSVHVSDVPLAL